MKLQTLAGIVAIVAAGAVVCWAGISAYRERVLPIAASGCVLGIERAIALYNEAGRPDLHGKSNREIMAALRPGEDTPGGKADYIHDASREYDIFIILKEDHLPGEPGHLGVDVWDHPLKIEITPDGDANVSSAGPNSVHGDADDIGPELARAVVDAEKEKRLKKEQKKSKTPKG